MNIRIITILLFTFEQALAQELPNPDVDRPASDGSPTTTAALNPVPAITNAIFSLAALSSFVALAFPSAGNPTPAVTSSDLFALPFPTLGTDVTVPIPTPVPDPDPISNSVPNPSSSSTDTVVVIPAPVPQPKPAAGSKPDTQPATNPEPNPKPNPDSPDVPILPDLNLLPNIPGLPHIPLPIPPKFPKPDSPSPDTPNPDNPTPPLPPASPTQPTPGPNGPSSEVECTTSTVASCVKTCTSIVSAGSLTTTCADPSCTSVTGCSVTATTSTTIETPEPSQVCYARLGDTPDIINATGLESPLSVVGCGILSQLSIRNVDEPGEEGIDEFIQNALSTANRGNNILENRVDPGVLDGPLARERDGNIGLSSSMRRIFGSNPFTAAIHGQLGCTTLFVIAKRGMWIAHIWETPAISIFIKNSEGHTIAFDEPDPSVFFEDVVSFINVGDGPGNPGLQPDVQPGGIFSTDLLNIIVISPRRKRDARPSDLRHGEIIGRILGIINSVFPTPPNIEADLVDYIARKIRRSSQGTYIVQYEPQQVMGSETKALVRIYENGKVLPDITWDPLPEQRPPPGRRQIDTDSGCTPLPSTLLTVPAFKTGAVPDPTLTITINEPPTTITNENDGATGETIFPLTPDGCTKAPCIG